MKTKKSRLPQAKRYELLRTCVEVGTGFAIHRWLKYCDFQLKTEHAEALADILEREILNEICERFEV